MTPAELYRALAWPDACHVGKRIFKTQIQGHGSLTKSDKTLLSEDVEGLQWQWALRPETIGVPRFVDETREYVEIHGIEVRVTARRRAHRVAEIVHRTIPYPLLLVLHDDDGLLVSVAHKRESKAERGEVVAESPLQTPWLDGSGDATRSEAERAFLRDLALERLPQGHLLDLYSGLASRVLALVCSAVSGTYRLGADTEEVRRERLLGIQALERQIATTRAAIHDATSFADKVTLNTTLKQHERRLAELSALL